MGNRQKGSFNPMNALFFLLKETSVVFPAENIITFEVQKYQNKRRHLREEVILFSISFI